MVTARPLNKRTTAILIAAILALGTGLLMYNYLSSVSRVAAAAPMRTVVIATHDIPARTTITPAMIATTERRADSIDPDAADNAGAVAGQMALISIPTGGILSASKIGQLQLGGLSARILSGQRAMSIPVDHVKGIANLVQAGDHVDVIAVSPGRPPEAPHAATILRNKLVLAIGGTLAVPVVSALTADSNANASGAVDTATLSVTPSEAKTLALADLNATLRLDLRSVKDGNRAEPADTFTLDAAGPAAAAPAPPVAHVGAAAAPTVPAQSIARTGILVIDGDQIVGR